MNVAITASTIGQSTQPGLLGWGAENNMTEVSRKGLYDTRARSMTMVVMFFYGFFHDGSMSPRLVAFQVGMLYLGSQIG